ncbi:MAG: septal ring lytic transglycosylase RlpA family protein [Hyphomonadaceae bacterium]|nr:septal ring lytic transglycosylase RlpA family protein [Hyphomonadaceae bacterium]
MLRHTPRALVVSCFGLLVFATGAQAQRAPITYASNSGAAAVATETAAASASGLAGGDDNSYGYGPTQPRRSDAVIDLRRTNACRTTPVVFEPPVTEADEDDDDSAGPVSLTPSNQQVAQAQTERPAPVAQSEPAPEQGAQPWLERERTGPPYEANGRWYVPTPEPGYQQTGTASWYGAQFQGQRTASGETFDQDALTAAHPTLLIPSLVQVTNLENGREVIVRVNDRGPFTGDRLIDVSRGAANVLGFAEAGHARVNVRYLGPAPRRVNMDGSTAPESVHAPATQPPEEGPRTLLQQQTQTADLAGAPVAERPVYRPNVTPGAFFVQVGAYSDPSNAQRVRDAVSAAGPVVVDTRTTASGAELFRVRVGPWASREEADAARRTLSTLGYAESVVAAR